MTVYRPVPWGTFTFLLAEAQSSYPRIREATTFAHDLPEDARYWLSSDWCSGYGVTTDGELIGVFSLIKGRGDAIVSHAVHNGAWTLDCFDGYLPKLYARHGFSEYHRAANWTDGCPDVVYLRREVSKQ